MFLKGCCVLLYMIKCCCLSFVFVFAQGLQMNLMNMPLAKSGTLTSKQCKLL